MKYESGRIALTSFVAALVTFAFCEYLIVPYLNSLQYSNTQWLHLLNYGISYLFIRGIYNVSHQQISHRAVFLGYTFSSGLLMYNTAMPSWKNFGMYVSILSTFHLTEYLGIAFTNPAAVNIKSFFINHSPAYVGAAIMSWLEFFIERYYFVQMKQNHLIVLIGLILCFCGEMMRKLAIYTAERNFNHIVQHKKAKNHTLVTHGVYAICRHPSYAGWFYWSIGTQLILQNPVCLLAYAIMSWRFFNERIMAEEVYLLRFFGQDYVEYQKKVKAGLPFIKGYTEFVN
ncbi:protein-S-isoprenylcysteine O-methyltransferase [Trichogramma pretiosum]|uniref:protein-S-isoprenylcysteine O-methyltransferase n=1 Tax=Trichogramma pretiosum TaxID=7493 RepID=UPI0006C97F2C|nr:protein-S-isoprenylcysteine O-methyltransferase [Trichogramma pretiosum]